MSESFVPLVPVIVTPREAGFVSMPSKGPATADTSKPAGPGNDGCSQPVVTLQRNGDVVSGIRIQCGCGQVIELACTY